MAEAIVREEGGLIKAIGGDGVIVVDREGRVIFFGYRDRTYRRSLFNRYLEVGYRDGLRVARPLGPEEAREVAARAYEFMGWVAQYADPGAREDLEAAASRGPGFLEEDARRFYEIYGGEVPIVPPDQYFPVYLQASIGCYWNRCAFCNLYRGKAYRVKGLEEFRAHVREIKEAFGRGLGSRRSAFIGDANALAAPQEVVAGWLRAAAEELGLPAYSFVDAITTQRMKGAAELRELRRLGLSRIYLGLESGSPAVLRMLGKPEDPSGAVELVNAAKEAGLSAGVIVLVGAGGRALYEEHVRMTADAISRMDLDRGDVVYLSPIYIYSWLPYYEESKALGMLSFDERLRQMADISRAIRERYRGARGEELEAPIVPYNLAEAIY